MGGASRAKANVAGDASEPPFPAASMALALTVTVACETTWPSAGMNSREIGSSHRVPEGVAVVSSTSWPEAGEKLGQPAHVTLALYDALTIGESVAAL